MFIFVGCAGGGTSSMFCQKIVKEIDTNDQNMRAAFADVKTIFRQYRAYGDAYDLVFAYGGVEAIKSYNAFEFGNLFDVVFVAPQVRYLTPLKRKLLQDYPTVVQDIPMKIFGMMNGKQAYDDLLDELIILDDERAYESSIQTSTKNKDKNMEIFIMGGDRKDQFFTQLFDFWSSLGIRCLKQMYSLEGLYEFKPEEDFDIRFIFGPSNALTSEDFPKIARRIDGMIVPPQSLFSLEKKKKWLSDYQIPYALIDGEVYYNKRGQQMGEELLDFLSEVQSKTEFTSEITVEYLEKEEMKKQKNFMGIIFWDA